MTNEASGQSRRAVLAGTAGLLSGLSGCDGVLGQRDRPPVSVLAAGSLQVALTEGLAAAVDRPVRVESHGSVTVARRVAEGAIDPDIVAVADPRLFETVTDAPWHATFATNELVVAVNEETEAGRRVRDTDRWYEPLATGEASLGRTDPELDPLGYRTLFVLDLAAAYYDRQGLAGDVLRDDQVYPETELLGHFETGGLDAAVVYRNMADERGYEFVSLPDEISLGSPAHADEWYSSASYELPGGTEVTGSLVRYAATVLEGHLDSGTRDVFSALVRGDVLREYGFTVPESFPTYTGNVPDQISA